jgi:hypothetical protein
MKKQTTNFFKKAAKPEFENSVADVNDLNGGSVLDNANKKFCASDLWKIYQKRKSYTIRTWSFS